MKPPPYQRIKGYIWRLTMPLYELDDDSRKFCLKMKDTLISLGLEVMPDDEVFYYAREHR